ncbi:4'-phosphopantetheinyl transferase sfp [Kordia sp. SMS9]|uniref:4'-phosphopantetheinyl transferase family protein n=1 Tax=Kordia sp. SMS9 TaxID=2282170 RepID=UPI000E0D35FC|nr:4'-phosphopantetheinyl transferase superfamily protein [Kordia sp. SMS9]AXG72402.1 4'-phosphopantetheinyl transferase sfp [Kordia sp. SMS9]
MTAVYYTKCEQLPSHSFEKGVSLLPKKMQERLRKYTRWQDAHSFLYGKLLLKEAISQFGYNESLECLQKNKYGKPYFVNSDFGFNISHSGEYIVCAISTDEKQNLGIDIEEIKPLIMEGFKKVFSIEEKKQIKTYDNFYTFWTRKEAIVKADGRGLYIPLNTINTLSLSVMLENKKYNLYPVDIDENYIIYMATSISLEKDIQCFYQQPIQCIH